MYDPLKTKGDILTSNGNTERVLGVGADGTILTADSTAPNGIAYKAPLGGGNVTGPTSAVNSNFSSFIGTSGTLIQDSGFNSASFASAASVSNNLLKANNLSDLANASTARTNLGLGTAATQTIATFLQAANNFSDLNNATTARSNLGLGSAATQSSATFLQVSNNLSDVSSKVSAYNNISPTTTKGDLIVFDGTNNVRFPIGTDGQILTADSTQTTGVAYKTLAAGGNVVGSSPVVSGNFPSYSDTTGLAIGDSGFNSGSFLSPSTAFSTYLSKSSNLSDLTSASTARTNLGLGSAATRADTFFLQDANNLSDLTNATTARTNLGLGTSATQASGTFLQTANNLSDVPVKATARTNLGLGTAAIQSTSFFLQTANNLSDVVPSTARTNLGLGTAATQPISTFLQAANNLSDLGNTSTARTNLGAQATIAVTGLVTSDGIGGIFGRTVTAGSTKLSVTNGNGVSANPTIDVTEANLTLSNMGGVLGPTHGGTNQSTYTTGDILYASATNTLSKLPIGANNTQLQVTAGLPSWVATAAASATIINTFSSSGTWAKNANTKLIFYEIWSGGPGGPSGGKSALRTGGSGSAAGTYICGFCPASIFSSSESITIGAGGIGGLAVTTAATAGNQGAVGGSSSIGTKVSTGTTPTSALGLGGVATSPVPGGVGILTSNNGFSQQMLSSGGIALDTANATDAPICVLSDHGTGSGAGGGINSSGSVAYSGSQGGHITDPSGNIILAGGTAGASGTSANGGNGGNGNSPVSTNVCKGGTGGGGGGGSLTGNGGTGGNGASPGGAGGAGGATYTGTQSGAGGIGGAGKIIIYEIP